MEAEFLSNVRYNLFASKDDWNGWHAKLRHFTNFYHKASLVPKDNEFVSNIPTLHFSSNLDLVSPLPPFPPPSKLPPMNGSLHVLGNCDLSVKNGDSYAPLLARLRNKIPQSVKSRKHGHDQSMDKNLVKRTAISSLPMLALPPSPAPTCMPAPTSVPSSHPMHPSQDQRHELSHPSISWSSSWVVIEKTPRHLGNNPLQKWLLRVYWVYVEHTAGSQELCKTFFKPDSVLGFPCVIMRSRLSYDMDPSYSLSSFSSLPSCP